MEGEEGRGRLCDGDPDADEEEEGMPGILVRAAFSPAVWMWVWGGWVGLIGWVIGCRIADKESNLPAVYRGIVWRQSRARSRVVSMAPGHGWICACA